MVHSTLWLSALSTLLLFGTACNRADDLVQPEPDYVEDGPCVLLPPQPPLGWVYEPKYPYRQQPVANPNNAEEVAYTALEEDNQGVERSTLYKVNVRTQQVKRLHQPANAVQWDNRGLLFADGVGLWRMTSTGDSLRRIASLPTTSLAFAVSPDGRQLAYTQSGTGYLSASLWVVAVAGGTPRQLATPGYTPYNSVLAWSVNSQSLALGAYPLVPGNTPATPHTLCIVDVGTGAFVAAAAPLPFPLQSLQWHPNGTEVFWAGGRNIYREPLTAGATRQLLREGCQSHSFNFVSLMPGQARLLVLRTNSTGYPDGRLEQVRVLETMAYNGQQVLQVKL